MPMSQNHLTLILGGKNTDDLIDTMLQALKLADACGSQTTYDLLRMALLNEGVQLARRLEQRKVENTEVVGGERFELPTLSV